MGHSSNVLGIKVGISYKQKIFFLSASLVNYFNDFTIYHRILYKYLYFLCRFKYYKIQQKHCFFFNSILFKSLHNKILFKIFFKDFFFEKFQKIFLKFFVKLRNQKEKKKKKLQRFFFLNINSLSLK